MDVTVSSRNVEVTESLRAAAREKIGRLERFLDGMQRAEVHFSEERNPRIAAKDVCEVTMEGHGHHIRARVAAADSFAAVDAAVAKLEQQLHKLKNKLRRRPAHRRSNNHVAAALDGTGDESEEIRYRIVKSKRFEIKPMTPEEAAWQMDLLGHDFFFFSNAETGRSAVVYRRGAGDVGLIDQAG